MALVGDMVCDVCDESSRYSPPFIDVVLSVQRATPRARHEQPALTEEVDPLFRAIAERGIIQPEDNEGRRMLRQSLMLGGCCAERLYSPEGRAALLAALEALQKLGPDRRRMASDGMVPPPAGAPTLPPPLP